MRLQKSEPMDVEILKTLKHDFTLVGVYIMITHSVQNRALKLYNSDNFNYLY